MDMPKVTLNLRNLADFSNLDPEPDQETPFTATVGYFRRHHPDFAPQEWWDYQSGAFPEKQWKLTQRLLREGWKHQFKDASPYYLIALLTSVFDPDYLFAESFRKLKQPLPDGVTVENTAKSYKIKHSDSVEISLPPRPAFANFSELSSSGPYATYSEFSELNSLRQIPLQQAIVYLFENSWRARFCAECNKRFVAAESKSKYCGDTCSQEAHVRQELKSYHKNKTKWRPTKPKRGGK